MFLLEPLSPKNNRKKQPTDISRRFGIISIGPCVDSLNSQDTHHVRDTLGLPSIGTKVLRYSPVKLELGVNKSIGKTYGVSKMGSIPQL